MAFAFCLSNQIFLVNTAFLNKFNVGKVIIKALPAIPTTDLTEKDIGDLMKKANDAMAKAFEELFDEVVSALPEDHYIRTQQEGIN